MWALRFREHSIPHFREEEEQVFPLVWRHASVIRETAELLRGHVRFEEDELFPVIERLVPEALDTIELVARDRS